MNDLPDVFEVDANSFHQLVVEQSNELPVLVDYWADWCAPCKMLTPILMKLVDDYQGNFKVAKVNTDVERELATQHAVRSLPTLRLYRHGEVVGELLGAQPESALRALIDPHIERASDSVMTKALELHAQGNKAQALQLLEQACRDDPGNLKLPLEYVRLAIDARQFKRARDVLRNLPAELSGQPESEGLQMLLDLAESIPDTLSASDIQRQLDDDPDLPEPRYQLAAHDALSGNYDRALENFLELLRRDRSYRDGIAQRALLALFALLGNNDPRVASVRRRMFNLLH